MPPSRVMSLFVRYGLVSTAPIRIEARQTGE